MDHLDEISVKELQDALDEVKGNKPTQRLTAAIAYKNGVIQTELAEGTVCKDERFTVGSSGSKQSRLSRLFRMIIVQ